MGSSVFLFGVIDYVDDPAAIIILAIFFRFIQGKSSSLSASSNYLSSSKSGVASAILNIAIYSFASLIWP